jgi:hypothetical protein
MGEVSGSGVGGVAGPLQDGVLDGLRATREDYAVAPILESFNWRDCLADVERADWYLVAFRSVREEAADDRMLEELDEAAHREAISHSGLLHYFRGELDEERRCLSFCVWEDRRRAVEAAGLPLHREAIEAAGVMYRSYVLERYRITARAGSVEIEQIEPPQRSEVVDRS